MKGISNPNSVKLAFAIFAGGAASTMAMSPVVAHADTVVVKQGESLKSIAKHNHVSVKDLAKANNLKVSDKISENQKLNIPKAEKTYTVKEGDTVSGIAKEYGLNTEDLLKWNNLTWENATIYVDDKLNLQDPNVQQTEVQQQQQSATTQAAGGHDAQVIGNTTAQKIVNLAIQYAHMGIPYVWGGSTPQGFDCSGLTSYVYRQAGIQIGRTTVAQETNVNAKPVSAAQPGDLLFWGSHGSTYHVAIYIGNNQYVAAPTPGQNVDIETINSYFPPSFAGSVLR